MMIPKPRRPLFTSLTRISDLRRLDYQVTGIPRADWDTGDYVLGQITAPGYVHGSLELDDGRMAQVSAGDQFIGALGIRTATLEAVGSWQSVEEDCRMQAMTAAGLLGRITSASPFLSQSLDVEYVGHITRDSTKVCMTDFVSPPSAPISLRCPVILIIGTSMSSGKTQTGRVIVRLLQQLGLRVVGAKLTGAGRFRDIKALQDAGASAIFDFVDAGLPSTVCSTADYQAALEALLEKIVAAEPDVIVAEAGASPLEPYNGETALARIRPHLGCTVLCASDPYAVVGVTRGFGFDPDFVSGVATSTSAGCKVVEQLSGRRAINALDPTNVEELQQLLCAKLGL